MEMLARLLDCLGRTRQDFEPDGEQHPMQQISPIERCPTELLQYLARRFLEASSVTALTLASKHMTTTFGTYSWLTCRENLIERQALLGLLERDLPGLVHCHDCAKLHGLENFRSRDRECDYIGRRIAFCSPGQPSFRLIDVQLAMKHHLLNKANRSNLSGLARDFTRPAYLDRSHVHHVDLQLRIVSDELLVRVQDWMILPEADLPGWIKPLRLLGWGSLCPHGHLSSLELDILRCRCNHWEQDLKCGTCYGLKQCKYCHTEYQLDTKRIGKYITFVFTVWRNYGSGLTRVDSRWLEHSKQWKSRNAWMPEYKYGEKTINYVAGSIKFAFEDGQPFLFDSVLTVDVIDRLRSKWL